MRLLLDTHVFVWFVDDNRKLRAPVRSAVRDADIVYVSAASAWEIAIKMSLGKLRFPGSVDDAIVRSGFAPLSVLVPHADAVASLPKLHGDPFDRMLVAQARVERLLLVTRDKELGNYPVDVLLA
ncbi:MAG: hypothetical protein AMXMBFR56_70120 [Polyangiaceae bacterium]